jgi:hypothetical protein
MIAYGLDLGYNYKKLNFGYESNVCQFIVIFKHCE